jgi:hypothetical protein
MSSYLPSVACRTIRAAAWLTSSRRCTRSKCFLNCSCRETIACCRSSEVGGLTRKSTFEQAVQIPRTGTMPAFSVISSLGTFMFQVSHRKRESCQPCENETAPVPQSAKVGSGISRSQLRRMLAHMKRCLRPLYGEIWINGQKVTIPKPSASTDAECAQQSKEHNG